MSSYDDYADRFLAALYLETEDSGRDFHSASSIHQKYDISPERPHWVRRMADDWEYSYFKDISKVLSGYDGWSFRISPDGCRKIESDYRDLNEIRTFLGQNAHNGDNRPVAVIRDSVEAEIVPASNRLVRLDHNQAEYQEIAAGLDDLYEQVRQDNQVGETADERDRLLRSLSAAKELWSAAELYFIQVRIGVAMAVDEATRAITKLGKPVASALLVDLIKRFIKDRTGIDF